MQYIIPETDAKREGVIRMTDTRPRVELNRSGTAYIIRLVIQYACMALCYFAAAGHAGIPRGWMYFGIVAAAYAVMLVVFVRRSPELLNERSRERENTKPWDKVLLALYVLIGFFATHIVAGLDARYGWSRIGLLYMIPGIILYGLSAWLGGWAMLKNKYFEATVRIQDDREQTVVTDGPYKLVRHPGYLSILLAMLGMPLMIGSLYMYVCAAAAAVIIVVRTALEDRALRSELKGYAAYAGEVRYRLIPLIW